MFNILKKFIKKEEIDSSPDKVEDILDVLNGEDKLRTLALQKENLEEAVYKEALNYVEEKINSTEKKPIEIVQGFDLKNLSKSKHVEIKSIKDEASEDEIFSVDEQTIEVIDEDNVEEIPEFDYQGQEISQDELFSDELFSFDEEPITIIEENNDEEIPEIEFQEEEITQDELFSDEIISFDEEPITIIEENNVEEIPEIEFQEENIIQDELFSDEIISFDDEQTIEVIEENNVEEIPEIDFQEEEITQDELFSEEIIAFDDEPIEIIEESNFEEIPETEVQEQEINQDDFLEDEIISFEEEPIEIIEENNFEEIITEEAVIEEQEVAQQAPVSQGLFGISFAGLKQVVSKTSDFFNSNILSLGAGKQEIDDDMLDQMEEKFIRADIGIDTTVYIIERLRENKNKVKPDKLKEYLKNEFSEIIKAPGSNILNLKSGQLNTFLITGVNGAGKTTLIGKLAYRFKLQEKKVLVAAGDTFRAAAEDQLEIWANRAGADIVRQDGADPASVVFDAIKKAQAENYDVLLIDTAGRLHNKFNLMEELRKIKKVIDKEAADTLVESILVLDATTGQNGLKQAEVFKEAVDLTSVGLTKLDGTAKGGVILGIARQLNLPVRLIGVGEKMEDLRDFSADDFIEALF